MLLKRIQSFRSTVQIRNSFHNVIYLVILQFSSNDTKRVVEIMLKNVYFAEARRRSAGYPSFIDVIVDHYGRPGWGNTGFTADTKAH